jgi:hypothetical protein
LRNLGIDIRQGEIDAMIKIGSLNPGILVSGTDCGNRPFLPLQSSANEPRHPR